MIISKKLLVAKILNIFFNLCYFLNLRFLIKFFLEIFIVKGSNSKLILYLSPQRSIYEINFLIKKRFSLLKLPNLITNEIVIFCIKKHSNVEISNNVKKNLKKIHFFSKIFQDINLKLIVSPAYHYKYDNLFADLFRSKNIKYLIIHREGYNFSKNHIQSLKNFIMLNQHKANKIIVHNKFYANIFRKMLARNNKMIEILGPLRMEELLKFKKINKEKVKKKNKILFLSFSPAYAGGNPLKLGKLGQYGNLNKDNIEYFDKMNFNNISDKFYDYQQFYFAHKIFLECVLENPNYDFELRLKFNNDHNKEIISNLCRKICGHIPSNLKFDNKHLWDSINQSYFVCGYGSTGMLESSILDRPSIQIINKNLINSKKKLDNLRISNHLNSFYIANSKKEFKLFFQNIVLLKKKPKKFMTINKKGKLAFKNFIFNYKQDNSKKFLKLIQKLL